MRTRQPPLARSGVTLFFRTRHLLRVIVLRGAMIARWRHARGDAFKKGPIFFRVLLLPSA